MFFPMKRRLVFLHLLDHTTTRSRKSWVEVFPFTGIRAHKTQHNRRVQNEQNVNSSFFFPGPKSRLSHTHTHKRDPHASI